MQKIDLIWETYTLAVTGKYSSVNQKWKMEGAHY
jgi:hypothetical protein